MAVTLNDVRSASDPFRPYNFAFIIPAIPTGANGDVLRLLVLDAVIPGFGVEVFPSGHFGFVIMHPGRGDFPRQLTILYEENNSIFVYNLFRNWRELLFNTVTGTQILAKTIGIVQTLDLQKNVTSQIQLSGLFPMSISDVPVSGQVPGSNVPISVTFSYDVHTMLPV